MNPVRWLRLEGIVIAASVIAAMVILDLDWWWVFVLFLAFDLSMIGYAASPSVGAFTYNLVHNFAVPAALGVVALLTGQHWIAILAFAWAFHVATDRALGYGLKHDDDFKHTHLGIIGRTRH